MAKGIQKLNELMHLKELDKICKLIYWGLIFGFLTAFSDWIQSARFTKSAHMSDSITCPEYFQSCSRLLFYEGPPGSYGQTIFYAFLLSFLAFSAICALKEKWTEAFVLLIPPTIFKFTAALFLADKISAPFEYFHLTFIIILLFFPKKISFLKMSFCCLYFFSGVIKIHEGWILGTSFSSLQLGLPLFPDALIPIATNFVIFLELTVTWFLLSHKRSYRLIAVSIYILFHLYSATIVGYRYPIHCLPLVISLFLIDESHFKFPKLKLKYLIPYSYVGLIIIFHLIPLFITGNQKVSYGGVRLSVGMFDANRQCSSTVITNYADGTSERKIMNSKYSGVRCVPYQRWFILQKNCKQENVVSINWTYDISTNGSPFYRVVDEENACDLDYKVFQHNEWIAIGSSDIKGQIVGHPQKNTTGGPWMSPEEKVVFKDQSIFLSKFQKTLNEHMTSLKFFYSLVALLGFGYFFILGLIRDQEK